MSSLSLKFNLLIMNNCIHKICHENESENWGLDVANCVVKLLTQQSSLQVVSDYSTHMMVLKRLDPPGWGL